MSNVSLTFWFLLYICLLIWNKCNVPVRISPKRYSPRFKTELVIFFQAAFPKERENFIGYQSTIFCIIQYIAGEFEETLASCSAKNHARDCRMTAYKLGPADDAVVSHRGETGRRPKKRRFTMISRGKHAGTLMRIHSLKGRKEPRREERKRIEQIPRRATTTPDVSIVSRH